jgi:hypothetical protein
LGFSRQSATEALEIALHDIAESDDSEVGRYVVAPKIQLRCACTVGPKSENDLGVTALLLNDKGY